MIHSTLLNARLTDSQANRAGVGHLMNSTCRFRGDLPPSRLALTLCDRASRAYSSRFRVSILSLRQAKAFVAAGENALHSLGSESRRASACADPTAQTSSPG